MTRRLSSALTVLALLLCMCMATRLAFAGGDHDDHGHDDHGHGSHGEHDDHGHDEHGHGHGDHGHGHGARSAPYPLSTCIVSGAKLDGKPVAYSYRNRDMKFADSASREQFKADPKKYIALLDKAIVKQEGPKYPLTVDVVTGAKLDDKPINYVYRNHLVRFASMDSIDEFEAAPAKYLKKIADARASKS